MTVGAKGGWNFSVEKEMTISGGGVIFQQKYFTTARFIDGKKEPRSIAGVAEPGQMRKLQALGNFLELSLWKELVP